METPVAGGRGAGAQGDRHPCRTQRNSRGMQVMLHYIPGLCSCPPRIYLEVHERATESEKEKETRLGYELLEHPWPDSYLGSGHRNTLLPLGRS